MTRYLVCLNSTKDRERAEQLLRAAPTGTRVEFKAAKRSNEQNAKLWAMLSEVSRSVLWHGERLTPDDWKIMFMDALKRELRFVPNIDGTGLVNLGHRSSDLSKGEFGDLLELVSMFGANHGVRFHDDAAASNAA